MRVRKSIAMFDDVAVLHANAISIKGYGPSTGLADPSGGMSIWLDPATSILGRPSCESTTVKSG